MRAARWVSLGAIAASMGLAMLSGCAEQRAPDAPASKPDEPMEVGAIPLVGDGFAGAALLGRF